MNGAIRASDTPVRMNGAKPLRMSAKYSSRCWTMSRAAAERSEHIDETEHLHFEMFVPHRERHHPLIKSGLAENRFRMAIDQIKDLGAASLDLGLQETHVRIVNRASPLGKSRLLTHSPRQ